MSQLSLGLPSTLHVLAARNSLESAVDKDVTRTRYSTWNRKKTSLFSCIYLRNRSTLDIGVLGYIGIF